MDVHPAAESAATRVLGRGRTVRGTAAPREHPFV